MVAIRPGSRLERTRRLPLKGRCLSLFIFKGLGLSALWRPSELERDSTIPVHLGSILAQHSIFREIGQQTDQIIAPSVLYNTFIAYNVSNLNVNYSSELTPVDQIQRVRSLEVSRNSYP